MKLSFRIVSVAFLAAAVGFLAAAAVVKITMARNDAGAAESLRAKLTEEHVAQCELGPASWSLELDLGARAFAYDAAWKASNPHAPALALGPLLVPAEKGRILRLPRTPDHGRIVAERVRDEGPCTVVAVHFNAPRQQQDTTLLSTSVLALVTSATSALGFLAIVRPFLRRVEELRRAAERVGADEYVPAETSNASSSDELTRIRRGIDGAHRRIVAANEALRTRLRTLEEHLANVAHDVRTPLASLQAQIEEALDSDVEGVARSRLQGALEDCVYVAGLTENLRLASRLEEGFDPGQTTCDLAAVVGRITTRLGFLARRRGIALEHSVPDEAVVVHCDAVSAEQAIGNVVENAVLNLREGSRIGVVLDRSASGFVLSIVDDGPGVADHEIPRLGERTFRTDAARARDPRGSGLGLAITRAVCERAGFALAFESLPGGPEECGGFEVRIEGSSIDG